MEYLILFLEGVITFISPCLLPMLPIYITYFIGDADHSDGGGYKLRALKNSAGFVLGFSIVFVLLGAAAGTIGRFMFEHTRLINWITGAVIVFFGLSYLGVIKLSILQRTYRAQSDIEPVKFGKAILFGMIFSIGWTPCVGTFLGSALLIAANAQTMVKGSLMLLAFSMGLGIPFMISAVLLDKMMGAIDLIDRHHTLIHRIAGGLLIVIGITMMTGHFSRFLMIFL
ncbi:MAG: cytochrome c biogenesis CcdA family protein [Peptostreptococcaceae bacterium]|nr:cytochrome c biogenesis CcdA family protein [Peptostreptococcaceae bacterium]